MLSPQKARKTFTTSSKRKERLLYNESSRSFFMAIIWNTQPQPLIEEEQEAIVQEAVDKAEEELDEELESARKSAPKGFGS
jgi:dUTPase